MRSPCPRHAPARPLRLVWAAIIALGAATAAFAAPSPTDWAGTRAFDATEPATMALDAALSRSENTVASGASGEWLRIAPPRGITRLQPTMVYDAGRARLVSFGGRGTVAGAPTYTNTVYVMPTATGAWTALNVAGTPPPARRLHRAIFDAANDRMIVYGGWNDAVLGDVWELKFSPTPTWTEITPADPGPGARAASAVAYDAAGSRMIVFGGFDGVSAPAGRAGDVWALSLSGTPEWTLLLPEGSGPSARSSMSGAFDAADGSLVIFGGTDPEYRNDVWKLSLSGAPAWTEIATTGGPPGEREEHTAQIDPTTHRMIVYGGYDEYLVLGDTWTLDLSGGSANWSEASPSPAIRPRWGSASALVGAQMYVYGGSSFYGSLLGEVRWIDIASPVTWKTFELLLPPRLQEVMVHDTNRDRLVVFGGTDGAYRNDTYTHSMVYGLGWDPLTTLGTPPPPRRLHTGIYDPVGDRLIVFGGYDDNLLKDLWQLSFATPIPTWAPLVAVGEGPSARGGHTAIYDPEGHRMIVFGGWDGATPPALRVGDTWELSLGLVPAWKQLATGAGPTARSSSTAVYDEAHHGLVVFGGTDPNYRNDAWRLSLDEPHQWTLLATESQPGVREEQTAAYDSKRGRMVIFGGYDPYYTLGDLWSLDTASPAWSQPAPDGIPPSYRWGAKAIYDRSRDGMWLYGGWSFSYLRDLWLLQWHDDPVESVMPTDYALAQADRVQISWMLQGDVPQSVLIERSTNGVSWAPAGAALPSQSNVVLYQDDAVTPGQTYAWRARFEAGGQSFVSDPQWLTIPSTTGVEDPVEVAFALRPAGRASAPGALAVMCALPKAGGARLELLDVAGRKLDSVDLGAAGAGLHRVEIGRGLPAGMFFARLVQGADQATLKLLRLP